MPDARTAPSSSDGVTEGADATRLARVPALARGSGPLEVLPGGLTNRNYVVTTTTGERAVARVWSRDGGLLAIDRHAEWRNTQSAAIAGVAPSVVEYAPDAGVLVVDWIDGRTFTAADLNDDGTLIRIATTCARLHRGPRFVTDFDMSAIQRRYLSVVRERGFRLPPDYLEFQPRIDRVTAALRSTAPPTVPCHNDLLPANMIGAAERVWFVDFEYAGNNDPCFELGNMWSEAVLPPTRLVDLVTAYYGRVAPTQVARARLFGLLANYGWTLWASIQDATSELDFDFWSWGRQKYDRAVAELRGPDLERLITAVIEPN